MTAAGDDVLIQHSDSAMQQLRQSIDQCQQSGLTGAIGSDDPHEITGIHYQGGILQRHIFPIRDDGIADIDECTIRPVDTARINILGTVQLLEAYRKAEVQRFVFASSAYVYSDAGFFYRSSKQACESFIENYSELYDLKYTCLRYGSLYGPRSDERNSIYKLIRQAVNEGKITYRGTGEELREFIHVQDAAQSSVKILEPEYENTYITITGVEKMRYIDLLDMIKEMLGNKISIEIEPSTRKAHYRITPYNFSPKLGLKLSSNPHVDMGQGLLQCIADIFERTHSEKTAELGIFVNNHGQSEET